MVVELVYDAGRPADSARTQPDRLGAQANRGDPQAGTTAAVDIINRPVVLFTTTGARSGKSGTCPS